MGVKIFKRKSSLLSAIFIGILVFCLFMVPFIISQDESGAAAAGSGALGGMDSQLSNSFQVVQQLLTMIQNTFGNLKTTIQGNQQAEHDQLAKINQPRLPEATDAQEPTVEELDTSNNRVNAAFAGVSITLTDKETGNQVIVVNRPGAIGSINTNSSLENIVTNNTTTIITKGGDDLGVIRVGNKTTVIDDGSAETGDPIAYSETAQNNSDPLGLAYILPMVSAEGSFISQNKYGDQFVVFDKKDIEIHGEDILVYPLKPYEEIRVTGSGIRLLNSDTDIVFSEVKTYYPREVRESGFFINKITNLMDSNNYFRLLPGGTKGNYLIDGNKIVTVGDAVVTNPLSGYENMTIPKTREAMWKKAAERV